MRKFIPTLILLFTSVILFGQNCQNSFTYTVGTSLNADGTVTVNFDNTSSVNAEIDALVDWDFGNATSAMQQDITSTTYAAPGNYTVCISDIVVCALDGTPYCQEIEIPASLFCTDPAVSIDEIDCGKYQFTATTPENAVNTWYANGAEVSSELNYTYETTENGSVNLLFTSADEVCGEYNYLETLNIDCFIDCDPLSIDIAYTNGGYYFEFEGSNPQGANTYWYVDGWFVDCGTTNLSGWFCSPGWHCVCYVAIGGDCNYCEYVCEWIYINPYCKSAPAEQENQRPFKSEYIRGNDDLATLDDNNERYISIVKEIRGEDYKETPLAERELVIYPNPATTYFVFQGTDKVEIYSMQGRLMLSAETEKIEVNSFSSGQYLVKGYLNGQLIKTEKLIVK